MGEMKLDDFQFYVPILVVVAVVLNYLTIVDRIMRLLGFSDDFFSHSDQSSGWENLEDGRLLLADARAKLERSIDNPTSLHEVRTVSPRSPDRQRLLSSPTKSNYNHPLFEKYRPSKSPKV